MATLFLSGSKCVEGSAKHQFEQENEIKSNMKDKKKKKFSAGWKQQYTEFLDNLWDL